MFRRLVSTASIAVALASLSSCDVAPHWTVTGVWINSPIRTDSTVRLVLQQDGNSITGVACSDVGPQLLLWTGVSVEGQFPEFTVTMRPENCGSRCGGAPMQLVGKVFDPDKIFLYRVFDGQLAQRPIELHRSSDQRYQCPPVSALQ